MHLSSWQAWTWLAGFLGYVVLVCVLLARKRYRHFPWFTFLIVQELLQSAALFEMTRLASPRAYFYSYWGFEIFDALVRVAVFFELARITSKLLRDNGNDRIRMLMSAILLASAICIYVVLSGRGVGTLLVTAALKISVCSSILGGVMVLSFVLTTFLEGIRGRIHSQAMAYGLFFYFSGKLLAQTGLLFGDKFLWFKLQNYTQPLYIVCLFSWAAILWFDEPKRVLTQEMDTLRRTVAEIEEKRKRSRAELAPTLSDILGL